MSEYNVVFFGSTHLLTSFMQADRLETMMRDQLKVQEHMDVCLDKRDKEFHQLQFQSQADGAQLAALSMQVQELISLVEARSEVVGKDLCQEIGLVAIMFFFELLFPYVSSSIFFYVSLTNLFSIILFLIC